MNAVLRQLASHRSIRKFRPDRVPEERIGEAVRAAQMAATSHWVQAYALLQVEAPATRARLRELTGEQAHVEEAGAFFVVCADARRHRILAERAGVPYVPNLETFLTGVVDAALFAQNLVVAFESQGYGICYIGGVRSRLPELDRLLEIPELVFPLFGLCVGVPAEDPRQLPRLPVEAVWMKERYLDDAAMGRLIDEMDAIAAAEFLHRGKSDRNWSGATWRQFQRPAREHLLAYYTGKGARFA